MKSLACFLSIVAVVASIGALPAVGESYPGADVRGTDALGRVIPEAGEVRPFQKDRYVGAFYFLWLGVGQVYDVTKILAEDPAARFTNASPPWGPHNAFHFWGEPMFGYYRSEDPWVLRRHAMLLSDAGVDFLVFDTTNAAIYEKVVLNLCEVFEEQRQAGARVPQFTFMVNSSAGDTARRIYELLYKPGRYPELWFRWQGKPLLICDPDKASPEVAEFFTLRRAHWPNELKDTHNAWHWEATYPQVYSYDKDKSKPEQINVSVGQNLNQRTGGVEMMSTGRARGRSFHGGRVDDRPEAWKYGFDFEEQWQRAYELDPEVVFVTGWNEWIAMQLNGGEGPAIFCDQYNLEFSRDVEMAKGAYGDNYYMQMAANIRRFKGLPEPNAMATEKTIQIDGKLAQWESVSAAYSDHVFDTLPRDHAGCGETHYRVDSGRNDLVTLKAAHDDSHLYFHAKTREPLSPTTDAAWMELFIDVKGNGLPDWEGYNFRVNGSRTDSGETSVEACTGGWAWKEIGTARYRAEGNELHLAIPKKLLWIRGEHFALDFKWIDNAQKPGDILDVYINGDAAPEGRFSYRYDTR